ncbi:MAG TPA: phosphotransferase, partial [Micromonosporaceae bacterium]|nr:phosphotransferase [Micromonosporaceae bacterium]
RVDTADGGRYLLRVHRPRRHGRAVDSAAAIRSELQWLAALRADAGISAPEPVSTRDGNLTSTASVAGVDEPRICSLLRWMDGSIRTESQRPAHLRRLGALMAQIHSHADTWSPPPGFVRIKWDWETFFGDTMEYGGVTAAACWDLLPDNVRHVFDRVAERMAIVMAALGESPDAFGLIHADLHLDNALFTRDDVRPIDFDDCGFGHRVYELAVPLWEIRDRDDYPEFRAALLDGYAQHRDIPAEQLSCLDDYIAARQVAFALWFVGTAQVNPAFAAELDEVLDFSVTLIPPLLDR